MGDDVAEEEPPELESAVKTMQFEWLDQEAAIAEEFCGAVGGGARFRCGVAERGALKNSDARGAQLSLGVRAKWDGRGVGIAGVRASHDFEQCTNVGERARHRADDADPAESASARREVASCRNATGRGL